jgi:hypothetical protein
MICAAVVADFEREPVTVVVEGEARCGWPTWRLASAPVASAAHCRFSRVLRRRADGLR